MLVKQGGTIYGKAKACDRSSDCGGVLGSDAVLDGNGMAELKDILKMLADYIAWS